MIIEDGKKNLTIYLYIFVNFIFLLLFIYALCSVIIFTIISETKQINFT